MDLFINKYGQLIQGIYFEKSTFYNDYTVCLFINGVNQFDLIKGESYIINRSIYEDSTYQKPKEDFGDLPF